MSNQTSNSRQNNAAGYDNVAMNGIKHMESPPTYPGISAPPPPYSETGAPSSVFNNGPMLFSGEGGSFTGYPVNGGEPYSPYTPIPVIVNATLPTPNLTPTLTPTLPRYNCAYCPGQFLFKRHSGLAQCPVCHQCNYVGSYAHYRGMAYVLCGLLFLLLGIGITVSTYLADADYYFIWIGGIALGLGLILRGLLVMCTFKSAKLIPSDIATAQTY